MPVPKPIKNEDKQDFLSRCMSSNTMKTEYKDTKQRIVLCLNEITKNSKSSLLEQVNNTLLASNCSWDDEWNEFTWDIETDIIYEEDGKTIASEYQGRKVTLNKPFRTPDAKKKFGVYVKNKEGKVIIVRFGSQEMSIKRDDPARRKSFRARHKCDQQKDKTTPAYWSCFQWRNSSPVQD
jgi:hypothetical protein